MKFIFFLIFLIFYPDFSFGRFQDCSSNEENNNKWGGNSSCLANQICTSTGCRNPFNSNLEGKSDWANDGSREKATCWIGWNGNTDARNTQDVRCYFRAAYNGDCSRGDHQLCNDHGVPSDNQSFICLPGQLLRGDSSCSSNNFSQCSSVDDNPNDIKICNEQCSGGEKPIHGKCRDCPCPEFRYGAKSYYYNRSTIGGRHVFGRSLCLPACTTTDGKPGYRGPGNTGSCTAVCEEGEQINDCGLCESVGPTCLGDKEPDPDDPNTCICPGDKEPDPDDPDACICPGDKIETPPGSGTCACPDGEEEYPAGSDTCVPECQSDEIRDEHGACVCPDGKETVTVGGNTTCEPVCTNGKIRESGGRGCVCPTGETLQVNGTCGRPEVSDPLIDSFRPNSPGGGNPDPISSLLVNTFNVHGESAYRSEYTIGRADRPDYICWLSKDKDANNKIIKNPQKDVIMRDYTCPHLSKCRQRECECEQLLSNGVWQSIEDTYCEYAYQDPLRLERDGDLPKVLGGVDRAIERNIHVLNVIVVPAH